MNKVYYTDNGREVKSIDLLQYPDEAWTFHSGGPDSKDNKLYANVAGVFRVANLSATAIANMPFAIMNESGDDIDTSDDWQNEVGFMPNPKELFRLWRLSLFMTNSAYAFRETVGGEDEYKYILPSTITPEVDAMNGLTGFKRRVGNISMDIPLSSDRIFWMWWLDHTTELLPSKHTEFQALMQAAGVIFYQDKFANNFLSRGGIKPTMLMVKGVPNKEDRDALEKIWDKVIRGIYKYLGKIWQADAIEPVVIGEGMEALKDDDLYENKLSDIAMAAGIPLSLLKANSANRATAEVEDLQWFNNSVIPWAEFMAEGMNTMIFKPRGFMLEFRPERTNQGQEEEQQRAGAYRALVASKMLPSMTAQVLGYELPAGTTDFTQLDRDYFEMLRLEAEIGTPESNAPEVLETDVEGSVVEPADVEEPDDPTRSISTTDNELPEPVPAIKTMVFVPTLEQYAELKLWQDMAFRKLKRDESMEFEFENRVIPDEVAEVITISLENAEAEADIKMAFDLEQFTFEVTQTDDIQFSDSDTVSPALAAAISVQLQDADSIEEAKMISESVWAEYP